MTQLIKPEMFMDYTRVIVFHGRINPSVITKECRIIFCVINLFFHQRSQLVFIYLFWEDLVICKLFGERYYLKTGIK